MDMLALGRMSPTLGFVLVLGLIWEMQASPSVCRQSWGRRSVFTSGHGEAGVAILLLFSEKSSDRVAKSWSSGVSYFPA